MSLLSRDFAAHETVNHNRDEYVRGNVTMNTAEGFFSILKRGLIGMYYHVSEQHLQRYVTEFDFRYNHRGSQGFSDALRGEILLKNIEGTRVTYY